MTRGCAGRFAPFGRLPHPAYTTRAVAGPNVGATQQRDPYDAAYVALAEGLGCTLMTCDAKLAHAGEARCHIDLIM